jgi:hypothetical protein
MRQLLASTEQSISAECIQSSVETIPNLKFTDRSICPNDSAVPQRLTYKQEPCLPSAYSHYVSWAAKVAMKCVGSISERPISSEIIFKKLHNESKFGFHLSSTRGKGIGQLVTNGVTEVYRDAGRDDYLDRVLTSPDCKPFHEIMKAPLRRASDESVKICQLVSPGNGLGRNIISSFLLFAQHRDNFGVDRIARKNGIVDPKKIDYLTLITFGREGFPGMKSAIEKLKEKYTVKEINAMSPNKFANILSEYSDYIAETERSAKAFAKEQGADENNYNEEIKNAPQATSTFMFHLLF